jgi:hypothetical protein
VEAVEEPPPATDDLVFSDNASDIGAEYMNIHLTDDKGRRLSIGKIYTQIASSRYMIFVPGLRSEAQRA